MKKKTILCSIIASTLLGGGTLVNTASAAEIPKENNNIVNYKDIRQQGAIIDIDQKIDNMLKAIPLDLFGFSAFRDDEREEKFNVSGINIKETNATNITPLFLGQNTFNNASDLEQTYNTSEFSQSITQETSTTTQLGFNASTTAGGKAGIPFVAEGEVSATLEFNYSHTGTDTSSTTNTITAPSQSVKVPAHKIYKAEVYFEKKKTSGQVEMYADILTHANQGRNRMTIGEALDKTKNKYGLIKSPNDPDQVRAKGNGHFTIEYGTNLIVKTYDITSGQKSAKLIDTKTISLK
ncbi:ETX/MTX2 family pore-forming toxin [Bacillus cereus group sp. BfR-BA-01347]|uniref:ETX/MTX2 family pore-forming toxin n=1 Tax=Bacillus cereus group sp. BfR-BA-01347 TaxID=2920310 RepID=UPI001F59A54F|nr:ETX/MTX2 family pore-forming toxin [Bacillus cereus group sp. BfR-BA-01347]